MSKQIILVAKSVTYYCMIDEDMFFAWINRISSITHYNGQGDELYLYVKSKRISNRDLRTLLALFYRYQVEMTQLAIFLNNSNKDWFYEGKHKGYWHKKVFKNKVTLNNK